MAVERIAVIGAGLMGHGIAQVFACAGHDVTVQDPFPEALATLHERVAANLRRLGLPEAAVERISRATRSPTRSPGPRSSSRPRPRTSRSSRISWSASPTAPRPAP